MTSAVQKLKVSIKIFSFPVAHGLGVESEQQFTDKARALVHMSFTWQIFNGVSATHLDGKEMNYGNRQVYSRDQRASGYLKKISMLVNMAPC